MSKGVYLDILATPLGRRWVTAIRNHFHSRPAIAPPIAAFDDQSMFKLLEFLSSMIAILILHQLRRYSACVEVVRVPG